MDHGDWCSEGYALDESEFEVECDYEIYRSRKITTAKHKPVNKQTRGAKVEVSCKCCGEKFMARVADRKRGWAKFCSKSCKAKIQHIKKPYF